MSSGLAATFGGAGFVPRTRKHIDEIGPSGHWAACGVSCESDPLGAVMLHWPGDELHVEGEPDDSLMLGQVDLEAMQAETRAIKTFYEQQGVVVHLLKPHRKPPPNLVFMRDLFFMTPGGAVVGRMGASQRAGEEPFAARALAEQGVPILRTLSGTATLEGADVLWADPGHVLVGVGQRTNQEGAAEVAAVLASSGVTVLAVDIPRGAQHLLGVVNFVDRGLAIGYGERISPALGRALEQVGVRVVALPTDDELTEGRGMNFVTLRPREVVMPAGCPGIRMRLEDEGITCHELSIPNYLMAAGGLGCLTGIVYRRSSPADATNRSAR